MTEFSPVSGASLGGLGSVDDWLGQTETIDQHEERYSENCKCDWGDADGADAVGVDQLAAAERADRDAEIGGRYIHGHRERRRVLSRKRDAHLTQCHRGGVADTPNGERHRGQ